MNAKFLLTAVALSGSLAMSTNVSAQPAVDVSEVQQACSASGAACAAAIRRAVATLRAAGLPAAQLNAQIAAVTGAAISASQSLPAAQRAAVSPALLEAAALSTDAPQVASLRTAAAQVQAGLPVTLTPVGETASPS